MPEAIAPAAAPRSDFKPGAASVATAVVLALSATTIVVAHVDARRGSDYQLHTLLLGSDLALVVLALVAARGLPAARRAWREHACALGALVVGLFMLPGLLVHPSDRGVAALLRLAGAVALALSVGSARRDGRRLIFGALAVVSLVHVAVGLAERAKGAPLGLGTLGEPGAYVIGDRYASTGLLVHPYVLAAWCAVAGTALLVIGRRQGAAGRLAMIAGIAAYAGIGLTMSRAAALAGLLALATLAVSTRRSADLAWKPVIAAAVAFALGIVISLSGWLSRAGEASGSAETVSSGRGALLRQAWALLRDHPLSGVGPGRYVLALSERPTLVSFSTQGPRPVHLTPLLLVVEGGLLVLPALLLLAIAVGRACWRGGAPAVAVAVSMLPFLALDHLAWSYPQGLILTGVWLGVLDVLGQRGEEEQGDDLVGGHRDRAAPPGEPVRTVTEPPSAPA